MSTQLAGAVPPLTLGWRMQMALGYAGVSVQEMADELGMARNSLSRWLNDHGTPPRAVFLRQWALRTGVDYQWLVDGEGGPGRSRTDDLRGGSAALRPLLRVLRAAPLSEPDEVGAAA